MGYYDRRELPFYWNVASRLRALRPLLLVAPVRHPRQPVLLGVGRPRARRHRRGSRPGGYGKQPTIFDRLQAAGVSWKFYVQDYNPRADLPDRVARPTRKPRPPGCPWSTSTASPTTRCSPATSSAWTSTTGTCTAGTLPAVAYVAVLVRGRRAVRPVHHRRPEPGPQRWSRSSCRAATGTAPRCMWSYDGSGGWYDHVAPARDRARPPSGFRVPALLVSAYARQGQVNHTVLDYTGALKFIEQNWRLPPLTARDATANSLSQRLRLRSRAASARPVAGRRSVRAPDGLPQRPAAGPHRWRPSTCSTGAAAVGTRAAGLCRVPGLARRRGGGPRWPPAAAPTGGRASADGQAQPAAGGVVSSRSRLAVAAVLAARQPAPWPRRGRGQRGRVAAAVAGHHHDPHRPGAAGRPVHVRRHALTTGRDGRPSHHRAAQLQPAHPQAGPTSTGRAAGPAVPRSSLGRPAGPGPGVPGRPCRACPMRADYTVTAAFAVDAR